MKNGIPPTATCVDLLEFVRQMRPEITWLGLHCAADQQEYWLRARVAQGEGELHFVLLIPDGEATGIVWMAAELVAEAERLLSGKTKRRCTESAEV